MNIMNFPTAEQFDIQNALLASIASNSGGIPIASWADVQRINRMGLAHKNFTIGDQFLATYNGVPTTFNLIGINKDTPADSRFKYSMTLQPQTLLGTGQISASQAMYHAVSELPAGTYNVLISGVYYEFTTAITIPAGGVITFPWAYNTEILTTKPKTFSSQTNTTALETLTIIVGSGGTNLATINDVNRCRYGSNRYIDSAARQFLNSTDAAFAWVPKGLYDMPPSYSGGGFLNRLDPELVAVLGAVKKNVARASFDYEGSIKHDEFIDKVFLLSQVEMGYGRYDANSGDTLESVYPFWDGASNADRIKGSPSYWWVRSPLVGNAYSTRLVYTAGELGGNVATNAYSLAPACVII